MPGLGGGGSSCHGSPLSPQLLTPPPCLLFLPSWPPSLVASLLPVVYFLFCFYAEEMDGEYPRPANPTRQVFQYPVREKVCPVGHRDCLQAQPGAE